jgi:RimJ/RimL family protein N-acetyltransferase
VTTHFDRVDPVADWEALVDFLTGNHWPFHSRRVLSADDVAAMDFRSASTDSYWIVDADRRLGLIRLLDLDDIDDPGGGSPMFDLRIEPSSRGRGLGTKAVRWLTHHLFCVHEGVHRIEATTRDDNVGMQRVFERCGYQQEGRLRQSWHDVDGTLHDTLVYAVLRTDPAGIAAAGSGRPT